MYVDGNFHPGDDTPSIRTLTAAAARALDEALHDVDWATLPCGAERVVFPAPSGDLAGFALGPESAPRFLLVPGVTGSKEDFVLMAPLLAEAGFRVESYDLAGQYESHQAGPERLDPPRPAYDHALFVDDLLAVLKAGSAPAHVLGYSFGGTLAQIVAVERPDLFASLTLMSTPPASGQTFRKTRRGLGLLSHFVGARGSAGLMLWGIRTNKNRVERTRLDFVLARLALTRRSSVDDILGLMRATPDLDAQVRALDIPKLVAFGDGDLWHPSKFTAFARRIGAATAEYPSGHSPCEEVPHQLTRDMLRLLGI